MTHTHYSQGPERPQLILASGSPYRRECLQKLRLPFTCQSPDIDETPQTDESVEAMTRRLATQKAEAIALSHPQTWVIGSDQSASFQGTPLGKPHTYDRALEQLRHFSGQTVTFFTALTLITPQGRWEGLDQTQVRFRHLDDRSLRAYLLSEEPYDCAGSFKSEGLGITLFESIQTSDPNALIGLPLIQLTGFLREAGLALPLDPD
ncbi:Maf family protein [Hydrogenovibrio halophilus]|uniref:Maf family protein n=1 Tax=Hydrogenovibrio halophilus TaxID=373391 RepID=UPI00037136E3|nr:Maf family nucleotide pyrophosphatase [Hydrogenovibrio halophilus]